MLVLAIVIPVWMYYTFHLVCRFRRIEEKAQAGNVFMASLSHELRTPLSGVSGAVQLLQDTKLDERQREYARMISYANTTLLEVLDDMLNYSRIESGKYEAQIVPFDVHAVIDDMLSLQTIQAQKRGIALIRDIDRDVPVVIMGDRRKLNQVLLNIIGNAIKFTDEGSVTIAVTAHPSRAQRVMLHFSITDTGIGVPSEQCAEVFKPFVQVEHLVHGRRGGTGLGLAICRRLIDGMGGDIRLDSKLNEGSRIRFHLEFDSAASMPATASRSIARSTASDAGSLTVLLVEDDEINRLVCTRYLASNGHHPLVAGDGRQVLHILQSRDRVDAILMDMNLPGTSGIDLAMQIREMQGGMWKQVPVIVMSADLSGNVMERSLLAGMSAFLRKPFTSLQLNETLRTVTAGRNNVTIVPADHATSSFGAAKAPSLLDAAWVETEIGELGVAMMLELLNIFRAGVATDLGAIDAAVLRKDWISVAGDAHRLRSAAGNLGMTFVVDAARQLEIATNGPIVNEPVMDHLISELARLCHASCDELRSSLLAAHHNVPLATDGDD